MSSEFFSTAEIALNESGQSWGNLGLWRESDSYSDACRSLALALGSAAKLDQQSHVLDMGFGCGDQLLLWLEHFQVATLQGVNLSVSQTRRAVELLQSHGHRQHCDQLSQGDASNIDAWPTSDAPAPNRILCLDCAYHFPERGMFLVHAARQLSGGGTLCLTEFVLAEDFGAAGEIPLRVMLGASRIPRRNLVTWSHYREQLAGAGFDRVEASDLSEDVMLGFADWWSRYRAHAEHLPRSLWLKYAVTARFLRWAYRQRALRYILISAVRLP